MLSKLAKDIQAKSRQLMIKLPHCQSKSNVIQVEPRKLMTKLPPLQNQIQCKSSKTATADDQVIPLQKQMDHPQISLPMQKKDKPCPFIVRRGWCIKGQECDFSHANLVNNLDLRKPVKTRKVRGPKPSSFLGIGNETILYPL